MRRKHSEFEIQAMAYIRLAKEYGKAYSVRGEYRFWAEDGSSARLDIAILTKNEDEIRLIVAVKRRKTSQPIAPTQRIRRQSSITNCPVVVIRGMYEAIHAVETVQAYLQNNNLQL